MLAIELVFDHLEKLGGIKGREHVARMFGPANERLEGIFKDRQSRVEKSLQSRGKKMGPSCIKVATGVQFFRKPVDQHKVVEVRYNFER